MTDKEFNFSSVSNDVRSFVKNNVSIEAIETLDIEKAIFYQDDSSYTVLQRDQSYDSENRGTNGIKLYIKGLVSKIVLDDFPISGEYTLSVNGIYQCTARLAMVENNFLKPTFDLANLKSQHAKDLRTAISVNVAPCLVNKCYDMDRVDSLVINVSADTKIKRHHKIIVSEYQRTYFPSTFSESETRSTDNTLDDPQIVQTTYDIYPYDTHDLAFNHPVYALDIISNKKMDFLIVINGVTFGKFTADSKQYIRLSDDGKIFQGAQNYFLGPEQQRSINLSRVGSIQLIVLNNDDNTIRFHVDALTFVTYCKRNIVRKFCN